MSEVFSRKPSPQECDHGTSSKSIWKPRERARGGGGKERVTLQKGRDKKTADNRGKSAGDNGKAGEGEEE